jgi:3-isopropylmalate/(R)-2-methylmalate dehydratase large subunit
VIEFCGDTIAGLDMNERMTLCNMTAELGAKTGIIAPDATTAAYLRNVGLDDIGPDGALAGDADAPVAEAIACDASTLAPQIAAPHSPANAAAIGSQGHVAIDQAYIGACTGAKLTDLHMAAEVLGGRKVAPGVRLLVAPASTRITAAAARDGTLARLTEAGAILLPSGCGACAGLGAGLLAEGETCISSTSRNFRGRMGAATAEVWLASPYTVAASAVAGYIADPREMLA